MNRFLMLVCLLPFLFTACNKSDAPSGGSGAMTFEVNNITDVPLQPLSSYNLAIEVKYISGTAEAVTITTSNLPTGVKAIASPASGTPTYNSTITFTADNTAPQGTYTIKIKATTASGISQQYDCNLNISPATDCSTQLLGVYNSKENCGGAPFQVTVGATATTNRVNFSNFHNSFTSPVYGDINCNNHTINIPSQFVTGPHGSVTVSGVGAVIANDSMVISFHAIDSVSTADCTVTMVK
jgi:hypothetical protein